MPVRFSTFPYHIQKNIAQKLKMDEFHAFRQSSYEGLYIANRARKLHTLPTSLSSSMVFWNYDEEIELFTQQIRIEDYSDIRFDAEEFAIMGELDETFCRHVIDFFSRTASMMYQMTIGDKDDYDLVRAKISCSPDSFRELLEASGAREVQILGTVAPEYLRNIPTTVRRIEAESPLIDVDLLTIRMPEKKLSSTNVSSYGLNVILKEWTEGKRRLSNVSLETRSILNTKDVLNGIAYTETEFSDTFEILRGSELLNVKINEFSGIFEAELRYL